MPDRFLRFLRHPPIPGDRILGMLYLVVVPALILGTIFFSYADHRSNANRARRIANRAEEVAQNSCESSAILRDVLASVIPASDPKNLTAAQKTRLNVLRDAVRRLGPLSCEAAP